VRLGESWNVSGREEAVAGEIYMKRDLMICTAGETELG